MIRALRRAGAGMFGSLLGSRFTVLAPSDATLAELPDELAAPKD